MNSSRRNFLKMAGVGMGSVALGLPGTASADIGNLHGYPDQYGVLVDTTVSWAAADASGRAKR